MTLRRVILESPYRGKTPIETLANIDYARRCIRDCLDRNEAPIASHLLYTQDGILDDDDPSERSLGIDAGHAWISSAHCVVAYIDRGISEGMEEGMKVARESNIPVEMRKLGVVLAKGTMRSEA